MLSQILSKKPFENKTLGKKQLLIFGIFLIILFSLGILFVRYQSNKNYRKTPVSIPKGATFVPDEIIVKYKEGFSPNDFQKKLNEIGVIYFEKVYKETEDPVLKRYYLLKLKQGTSVEKTYEKLTSFYEIENIQPNYIMQIFEVPNDPRFTDGSLWGLGSTKLDMEHAWNITKGSDNIKVAVIDTGIDYNHQDFVGRQIINGKDFSTGDCIGIGGAYDPPKPRDDDSLDDMGHGTHVAGTIGAVTNNGLGIAGINWNVTLMAVKTMSKSGCGQTLDITDGIKYAADNGANVINMSLGSTPSCSQVPFVQDVINYAINKKVIVVAAAGNDGKDVSDYQPASCEGVMAVGATDSQDKRSIWSSTGSSNYGSRVDIAAPGTSILSTKLGGGDVTMSGTSMATPHVAGAVAILLAACPNLSPQQVRDYLVSNADPISTDMPIGPRLNVYKALNACTGGVPLPTLNPTSSITPTNNPSLTPGLSPTSGISPTSTINPTSPTSVSPTTLPDDNQPFPSKKPTPTPIPYTCVPDQDCLQQGSIQMCNPYKCTPL